MIKHIDLFCSCFEAMLNYPFYKQGICICGQVRNYIPPNSCIPRSNIASGLPPIIATMSYFAAGGADDQSLSNPPIFKAAPAAKLPPIDDLKKSLLFIILIIWLIKTNLKKCRKLQFFFLIP